MSKKMWYYSDEEEAEDNRYSRLHNQSSSKCLGGTSPPSCAAGGNDSPPSSAYRKALSDISEGLCRDLTKSAHSYGTMPRLQSNGYSSCSSKTSAAVAAADDLTNKLLKLSPDQIATQITLGDFPVFKAITPEELTTCGWTKKDKHKLSPNVVQLTRRFNHLSFWVVHETLNAGGVKSRAEVMTHFVKVARRLGYLHNYHSQFAVISSLQSAPIYRLRKTWAALSRKDRNQFDRMAELFSEKNNWARLRAHVDSLKLPMIPYLGLFLTDIVYIDMAHPHFGGLESEQRMLKMNNLLRVLADYQQSDYSSLPRLPRVQQYLASIKYIEELQKFVEDDHYKLSLCLEPNTPVSSHNTSKDSLATADCSSVSSPAANTSAVSCSACPASPVRTNTLGGRASLTTTPSYSGQQGNKFLPGHRKARSLGTKFRSMSLPRNLHRSEPSHAHLQHHIQQPQGNASLVDRLGIFKGCSIATTSSSEGSRCDSLSSLGGGIAHDPSCPSHHGSKHLLDDSDLDPPPVLMMLPPVPPPPGASQKQSMKPVTVLVAGGGHQSPAILQHQHSRDSGGSVAGSNGSTEGALSARASLTRTWSAFSAEDCEGMMVGMQSGTEHCLMQGPLRRKTVLKDGRKPAVGAWHRYWVQLWGGALVYYHPKSLASKGFERCDFKNSPCKLQPLVTATSKLLLFGPHQDTNSQHDLFQLSDQSTDTIYKFRAPSVTAARNWFTKLAAVLHDHPTQPPENLISFE